MRRQSWGRASGLAMTHGHRDFTVCSCSLLPVLLTPRGSGTPRDSRCSTTADKSGEPVMRSALVKARRRIACCTHCGTGCSHAPRPGRLLLVSTITACLPFPSDTATTRSSSTANSRFRHPTHVRTGPSTRLRAETEGSRWITAQSSVTYPIVRTARRCGPFSPRDGAARPGRCASGRVPSDGRRRVRGGPPNAPRAHPAYRRGCRCATR